MLEATPHAPLVLDIAGTTLDSADRHRLKHPLTGGVILFARNCESRAQITALTAEIKAIRPDVLIAIDHEGGRVQRFARDGFTHLPAMRVLGELWMEDAMKATAAASACGEVLALELRACGVDFSFTPVLDLDYGRSAVIGNRAFHRDPRVVALLAKSLMHGLLRGGMQGCGKHFPGHGHVEADSHHAIPVDKRSLKAILADDAAPYGWLGGVMGAVMPAHVVYPKVCSRPAGFSKVWLQDILRERLRFHGAIFSDDLSMAGAREIDGQRVSPAEAAVAALQAGCDLVLLCNESPINGGAALDDLLGGLQAAHASGLWTPDDDSEHRRLALLPQAAPLTWDELMADPSYHAALEQLPA
ncbi:beta-N-acetylhexosaminidase [Inhella crocodyli]|uniref:Beta-hexosaminidase n=1 Tax=Inhella crocodyli TaxID=2499851 RepID=A0A437LT19_9BURK|nr:beta-N-acetylhexosaminidase [Inhella crocodyli]RVT88550.1 beta-N-acetylhexosaminidase [Inhella crocodyli]